MTAWLWALMIGGGFLAGGVMFSKLIPKLLTNADICEASDDKNPGAYNAFAHCGKKIGSLCLILDVLKGLVPVLLCCLLLNPENMLFSLVMLAPVLGHAVGLFNRFHGGKCIAVSFGVLFGILPVTRFALLLLAVLYIFFSTVVKIHPNSKRSILVYLLFGVGSYVFLKFHGLLSLAVGCALIAVTVIVKHLKRSAPVRETDTEPPVPSEEIVSSEEAG